MEPTYIIIDTETVGLNAPQQPASGICEVAWFVIDPDTLQVLDQQCHRVNPGCAIDPGASAVTGIYWEHVKDKPPMTEIPLPKGSVIHTCHNEAYDVKFLAPYYENLVGKFCTLNAARQNIKGTTNHKLGTLAKELNLDMGEAHSAYGDIQGTLNLLRYLVELTQTDFKTLIKRQSKPTVYHTMPFGMHKGKKLQDLPINYIRYFDGKELDASLRLSFDRELKMRG